ncbi:hypothetical protein L210DRAFT_3645249 [Boletus edulis BED1]|uniref:Uncharacterized protein n=1 Tax=Boletus edulis BED1 TaxID=1328754 RepID=A0AAD4BVT2_BOLED|nr:hypothetical protein L210DRAFT_3645249 [Boletus edulis BED1]
MASFIPMRGTPDAPQFHGTSTLLSGYFDDIEILSNSINLTVAKKIRLAIRYADLEESEFWETLPEATANPPDWNIFIMAVKKYYPGCEETNRYCRADLTQVVKDYQAKLMCSLDDLGEYNRAFIRVSASLTANNRLAESECNFLFLSGFPDSIRDHIQHRLQIVHPDIHPDDPYPMHDIMEAAKFLLSGHSFRSIPVPDVSPPLPTSSSIFLMTSIPANVPRSFAKSPAPIINYPVPCQAANPTPTYPDTTDVPEPVDLLGIEPDLFNAPSDNIDDDVTPSSPDITDPEFQSYLAEAWSVYQADCVPEVEPLYPDLVGLSFLPSHPLSFPIAPSLADIAFAFAQTAATTPTRVSETTHVHVLSLSTDPAAVAAPSSDMIEGLGYWAEPIMSSFSPPDCISPLSIPTDLPSLSSTDCPPPSLSIIPDNPVSKLPVDPDPLTYVSTESYSTLDGVTDDIIICRSALSLCDPSPSCVIHTNLSSTPLTVVIPDVLDSDIPDVPELFVCIPDYATDGVITHPSHSSISASLFLFTSLSHSLNSFMFSLFTQITEPIQISVLWNDIPVLLLLSSVLMSSPGLYPFDPGIPTLKIHYHYFSSGWPSLRPFR